MSGAGRMVFQPGAVLTASQVQNYLQDQAVQYYAGTAARGSAIGTATTEGMMSYLADTNQLQVALGTATWQNVSLVQSPNYIINGGFDIWQRGTSFTNPSASSYTTDRFKQNWNGSGATRTITRQQLSGNEIAGLDAQYFYRYDQTVAGTGGTYNYPLIQPIEDVRTLAGKTVTVSFWAKSSTSSTFTITMDQSFGSGGSSYLSTSFGSINVSSSWQRYSVTGEIPSVAGKTIGDDSSLFFIIRASVNAVINLDVAGVQIEAGQTATAFRRNAPNIQAELAACQRYYIRIDTSNASTTYLRAAQGVATSTQGNFIFDFPVQMRVAPTSVDSSAAGTWHIFQNNSSYIGTNLITAAQKGVNSVTLVLQATGQTSGQYCQLEAHGTQTAYFGIGAEL